jgi:hypothetical protein
MEIRRLSLVNVMAQTGRKPACFVAPANYPQGRSQSVRLGALRELLALVTKNIVLDLTSRFRRLTGSLDRYIPNRVATEDAARRPSGFQAP